MHTSVSFHPTPQDQLSLQVTYYRNNNNDVSFITVKHVIGGSEFTLFLTDQTEFERYLDCLQSGLKSVKNTDITKI